MDQRQIHIRQLGSGRYSVCNGIKKYRRLEPNRGGLAALYEYGAGWMFSCRSSWQKAGTGTAISYGRFGWIGMILVHPSQRRAED